MLIDDCEDVEIDDDDDSELVEIDDWLLVLTEDEEDSLDVDIDEEDDSLDVDILDCEDVLILDDDTSTTPDTAIFFVASVISQKGLSEKSLISEAVSARSHIAAHCNDIDE
ncbi:hypothetical protein LCGC14_0248940 [marine sediment metagenome]|uniref:Uncharacterized protein n=1 Tax=marine sediment metagenome TaxID=412755 RepID=A0A0F9ULL0_9ZZZZ